MNSVKYLKKYLSSCVRLLVITGLLAITGCAFINYSEPAEPVSESRSDSVIAQDFVNIMVQIEELSPVSTVLRFGLEEGNPNEKDARSIATKNFFGKALRAAVKSSGYAMETIDGAIKTVGSPSSASDVSFSIAEFGDAVNGTTYTYDVSVGDIDFRRVYKPLEDGGTEPVKSMLVRGVDVTQLETDDSIFANSASANTSLAQAPRIKIVPTTKPAATIAVTKNDQLSNSQPLDSANVTSDNIASNDTESNEQPNAPILDRPVIVAAPLISDLPTPVFEGPFDASANGSGAVALAGDELSTDFERVRKINIAVSGESNYENLLADKKDVTEEVLIFGDDSYVLGSRNKQILSDIIGKFNPDTDVVLVVGCSTGITKIVNGNAALAIGRANRVKEALLYSGVPHDQIFDEGCWSPNANSTPFPNRGVVVTVKRNVKKG